MDEQRTPIIFCDKISKHYGEGATRCVALKEVSLSIYRGELRLLMGPSGSGKTTLISIIAGILTQDSGICLVNNQNMNLLPDREKVHYRGKNIGFAFQIFNLIPSLTTTENITIPLLLQGVDQKSASERAEHLLAELGMGDKIHTFPSDLSGGQQQRVAIARALIHNPQIVVCDEPTSFLDHITGQRIMEILKEMTQKRNVTIIVVTHDARIVPYADKIDHLEDGMIVKEDKDSKDDKKDDKDIKDPKDAN